jgi:hypothetical protein
MGRSWYEVRLRVCISPPQQADGKWIRGKYTKKSKFYFTQGPQEAARKYKGTGQIMHVEKVGREKLLGIGEFFKLGDNLLKEFKEGGSLIEHIEGSKAERRQRIQYNRNLRRGSSE